MGKISVQTMRRKAAFAVGGLLLCWAALSQAAPLVPGFGNLNGAWRFSTDPLEVGEREGWHKPDLDDSAWRIVKAPGIWEAQGVTDPRPGQPPTPLNGLPYTDYDGVAWYRKHLQISPEWNGEPLVLTLGQVDDLDKVWFNGVFVGGLREGAAAVPSQVNRTYRIPSAAIRIPGPNIVAVQVTDGGGPGGLTGPHISLMPRSHMEVKPVYARQDAPVEERFRNPPSESRILPIWHNAARRSDTDVLIHELLSQGFGGAATNMPFDEATYMRNPQHWDNLKAILDAGKKADLTFWLYDELGYPSGTAGGLTMEGHPE